MTRNHNNNKYYYNAVLNGSIDDLGRVYNI